MGFDDKLLLKLRTTRYASGLLGATVKLPVMVLGVAEKTRSVGWSDGSVQSGLLLLPVHCTSSTANLP